MPPSILYHCSCTSTSSGLPPPPHLPSSSYAFHPLANLYFCEECDAVRCNRCATVEISGYYCPNCLFEVPSASVRAEKNRCARNCFACPICTNTLSVVSSDPPEPPEGSRAPVAISAVGEPPFFLYCNNCRWDSADAGITFEKPTGLALQLQKIEDSAPEILELEKLKEYFEPGLRAAQALHSHARASASHNVSLNPIQAAASNALSRDIPSFKYSSSRRPALSSSTSYRRGTTSGGQPPSAGAGASHHDVDDPATEYKPRIWMSAGGGIGHDAELDWVSKLSPADAQAEVSSLGQRWGSMQYSWAPTTSLRRVDLKPMRIPLRCKKSKRCPKCTHILIKPELKAQSVKYKIKLVAINYLPSLEVFVPGLSAAGNIKKTTGAKDKDASEDIGSMMLPGRTYPFHLIFSNPLYDPITVRVSIQRSLPSSALPATTNTIPEEAPMPIAPQRRPPYAVSLPTTAFPIAAFAEAWEYEDDEEMFDEDELGLGGISMNRGHVSGSGPAGGKDGSKGKVKTVGVLERRANVTKVGGEVVVSKDGKGAVKFNMLVSYTYRADDPGSDEEKDGDTSKLSTIRKELGTAPGGAESMKTFSFYTVVDLGTIAPKELVAAVEKKERRESVQTVGFYN